MTEAPVAPVTPPSEPALTEEIPLVRPSKVETGRVIPPERHVEKTELEKAQEAFARAEDVGIAEETGEGIVETRMLRASEVRELMDSAASWSEPAPTPSQPSETSDGLKPPAAPAMPSPKDIERGKDRPGGIYGPEKRRQHFSCHVSFQCHIPRRRTCRL